MSDLPLNLTAIAVFVMMLSVLIGPLIHLSSFVTALTTISLLGLITADQFAWQGQGSNLFLDSLASKKQRTRILHHEAGHFLAAYYLGIPIKDYTLSAWETFKQGNPGLGGVQFDTEPLENQSQNWQNFPLILERFATVWMAGIAAEQLIYGQAEGGNDDRQKLLISLTLSQLPQAIYPQKERWALVQAKNLLESHRTEYDALVQAMTERLPVADCCRIIQEKQV
ncbi:MAG: ATP-dependent Zn protease [Snowella sp.]